ncbi:MAG: class I SAM-dependent methyltransferase [Rhodospirillales bacterium]
MSSDTTPSGYVLDTPYLFEFQEELSPVRLNYTALLGGYPAVPLDRPFRYLDIGCGYGVTLAVLAAAFPEASFTGIDLNPDHIRDAADLASDAGNLRLLCGGFDDVPLGPDEQFDFVVMHGLVSWLDDGPFAALTDFLNRHVAPGGIVYASYNALPGWSATQSLRSRLLAEAATIDGTAADRAMGAIAALRQMKSANIAFFRCYPELGNHLDRLAEMDPRYVVHEFLNAANRAFEAADIFDRFSTAGLTFAGTATTFLTYVDLAFPPLLQGKARACTTRQELETLRDFVRNETFRKDVFVRGTTQLSADDWQGALHGFPVAAALPAALIEREVGFGEIAIQYDGEVFDPVIGILSGQAVSPAQLTRRIDGLDIDMASDATAFLVAGGQFHPALTPTEMLPVPERCRIVHDTTRRLIDRLAMAEGEAPVVAPALGSGIRLSGSGAMILRALDIAPDAPVDWLMAEMARTGHQLAGVGDHAFGDAMAREKLNDAVSAFRSGWLPKLLELGTVEAAD